MATLEKKSPATSNKLPHQQSLPTPNVSHHQLQQQLSQPMVQSKLANNNSELMQVSNEQQSDNSSLYSVELEPLNDGEHRYIDSDPGFGSMSSSEQAQMSNQLIRQNQMSVEQQEAHQKEVEELKQEVTKLKCDKLDLLRQNVVSWRRCRRSMCIDFNRDFVHRHANVISSDSASENFHFKATFRPPARRSCDSASCSRSSPRQLPATAPSLPTQRQCCKTPKNRLIFICFNLFNMKPKRQQIRVI